MTEKVIKQQTNRESKQQSRIPLLICWKKAKHRRMTFEIDKVMGDIDHAMSQRQTARSKQKDSILKIRFTDVVKRPVTSHYHPVIYIPSSIPFESKHKWKDQELVSKILECCENHIELGRLTLDENEVTNKKFQPIAGIKARLNYNMFISLIQQLLRWRDYLLFLFVQLEIKRKTSQKKVFKRNFYRYD